MEFKKLQNLVLMVAIVLAGFACNDSTTGTQPETVTVNGRVDDTEEARKSAYSAAQSQSVEGAVVTAARINSSGELEVIEGVEAMTNARGEFTLRMEAAAVSDISERIIVTAEKEGRRWKAYLYGKLEGGSSVELNPLNIESTGEASVFEQVVANGDTDLVSKADIEAFVGAQAAAELKGNADAAAQFAAALAARSQARSDFFISQGVAITEQQMAEIQGAKAEALAKLNAQLYATTSESAHAEAFDAFVNAVANAYINAGVNADAYARSEEMCSHLVIQGAARLSTDAQSEVRANTAALVAIAIDNAVRARMEASELSEAAVEAAAEAGMHLRTQVKAKTTASKSEISALFDAYNAAIVDILQQEFSADAEVIAGINSEINSSGGIKASLEATLSAGISTGLLAEAYTTFYNSVEALVNEQFTAATDAEAQLVADLMILINIAG